MRDNTNLIILAPVVIILAISGYNLVSDKEEMIQHQHFFNEMLEFKNKGGRNTSDMGRELCERLNMLEFHLQDTELTDCELVYK